MKLIKNDSDERDVYWVRVVAGGMEVFVARPVVELIVKRERRRAARIALKRVPCSICAMNVDPSTNKLNAQFCDSFGCSSFRELAAEIMGKKTPRPRGRG